MAHKLSPLRFGYDALEPYIDAETMELHHDKHHKAYVDNLNKALEPYPQLAELTVEDLLLRLDQVPETIRTAVRNNGGGHVNHQFFWDILGPRADGAPKGAIADAIKRDFGSFEQFQSLYRRGHKPLRLGMGVPRRERLAAPPRDRVAAQPGQRAGARDAGAPLLRCLGARLLPEVQKPPPGLPQRLVEGRRLGCGRRAAPRRHGGVVPALVRRGNSGAIRPLRWVSPVD